MSEFLRKNYKKMGILSKKEKRKIAFDAVDRLYSPNSSMHNYLDPTDGDEKIYTRNRRVLHRSLDYEIHKSVSKQDSHGGRKNKLDSLRNSSIFSKSPEVAFKVFELFINFRIHILQREREGQL